MSSRRARCKYQATKRWPSFGKLSRKKLLLAISDVMRSNMSGPRHTAKPLFGLCHWLAVPPGLACLASTVLLRSLTPSVRVPRRCGILVATPPRRDPEVARELGGVWRRLPGMRVERPDSSAKRGDPQAVCQAPQSKEMPAETGGRHHSEQAAGQRADQRARRARATQTASVAECPKLAHPRPAS